MMNIVAMYYVAYTVFSWRYTEWSKK